jgi:peptide deformylase
MIRTILRMGHPLLRVPAQKIDPNEIFSDRFRQLLQDMHDSMKHYGGIGIAAPQIGESLQVAIIELPEVNRYGEKIELPLTTFINPTIEFLTNEQQGFWEGCLSVPGLRGYVSRPKKIRVNYLDHRGEDREILAEGFLATVIQHELDHLFGVLYIDRIEDTKRLAYQEEFDQFIQSKGPDHDS